MDSQEIRGDEPPCKRAKRRDSQSRAQNPNLSRALEHIMQVAAEAQDAQSSSPMLRQAVRDEEVSHVLRQVLKEIKGLREDTKRQTEETREVSKLLKEILGNRIPSQELGGRPSNEAQDPN
uniref:Uncharacterized protein n=1 Tax=Guillardia theta TaxID=55529 RepID=A0A7S4NQZ3_GUITH